MEDESKIASKNLSKSLVESLFVIFKTLESPEAKRQFIEKAQIMLNVKPGQLMTRMELELIWEDFQANGADSEYKPKKEVGAESKVVSKLKELSADGVECDVILSLLHAKELYYCKFCRGEGLPYHVYLSHDMRSASGDVICPRYKFL